MPLTITTPTIGLQPSSLVVLARNSSDSTVIPLGAVMVLDVTQTISVTVNFGEGEDNSIWSSIRASNNPADNQFGTWGIALEEVGTRQLGRFMLRGVALVTIITTSMGRAPDTVNPGDPLYGVASTLGLRPLGQGGVGNLRRVVAKSVGPPFTIVDTSAVERGLVWIEGLTGFGTTENPP